MTNSGALLASLPKRARREVTKIMQEHGKLDLVGHLSTWFRKTPRDFLAAPNWTAESLQSLLEEIDFKRPGLSPDERLLVASFRHVALSNLADSALARRLVLEDPAELARGLFVAHRLDWVHWGCRACSGEVLVDLLAVSDWELACFLAEHGDVVAPIPDDPWVLASHAVIAIVRKDWEALEKIGGQLRRRKVKGRMLAWVTTLLGIAERNPDQIATALQTLLDPNRRDETALVTFGVFFPEVHGLFRLAESVGPELVARFDVTQGFPWDAEFHTWTESHEKPIAELDLKPISRVLHDAVVNLAPPPCLVWTAEDEQRREAELTAPCDMWLIDPGTHADEVEREIVAMGGQPPSNWPAVIRTGVAKVTAIWLMNQLKSKGAVVELRKPG
jgi:hypothetical protein